MDGASAAFATAPYLAAKSNTGLPVTVEPQKTKADRAHKDQRQGVDVRAAERGKGREHRYDWCWNRDEISCSGETDGVLPTTADCTLAPSCYGHARTATFTMHEF